MPVSVGPIPQGKQCTMIDLVSTGGAGSKIVEATIEGDSVLVSLFADVVSGTLDVTVYTITDSNKQTEIIGFPTLSAPTGELVLKKAAVSMQRIKVVAVYTGDCTFEVRARSIGIGETSVKIAGAAEAQASQIDVGTGSPTILIPSSITDRSGVILKNWAGGGTLFIGFTLAETTLADGWPVTTGETLAVDAASGVTVYGISDSGTIDVRLLEGGG